MRDSILIADDQRLVRESLRVLLESAGRLQVVAEAEDGRTLVDLALSKHPDVVVATAQLPRLSGIEAIRQIRRERPRCRCIITATSPTPSLVRAALLAGASGFVPKSSAARELLDAIQAVLAGRSYLAQSIGENIIDAIRGPETADEVDASRLTSRQREVLQLIAEGMSTREIASELGVSIKTAQTHRTNLMESVGIHKVSTLVRYAIREGIVAA